MIKHTIRFYKFKFLGYDTPVIIEAYHKLEARTKLQYFIEKNPQYGGVQVVSESLSLPVHGVSTKVIDGVEHVWIGAPNNWIPLNEYNETQDGQ